MDITLVKRAIETAFLETPYPNEKLTKAAEDEGTTTFFTGKEWRELDAVALRRYDASMHYFTPSAFRYFLPAFMLAELDDPEKADILGDYVVYQFEEPPPLGLKDFSQRIEQFSENEKEAILMFLNYMQSKYGGFEQQVSYAAAWLAANKALHRTSR